MVVKTLWVNETKIYFFFSPVVLKPRSDHTLSFFFFAKPGFPRKGDFGYHF